MKPLPDPYWDAPPPHSERPIQLKTTVDELSDEFRRCTVENVETGKKYVEVTETRLRSDAYDVLHRLVLRAFDEEEQRRRAMGEWLA